MDDLSLLHFYDAPWNNLMYSFESDGGELNWELTKEEEVTAFLGVAILDNNQDGSFSFTQ